MPQVFPGAVHQGPHAGDALGETDEQGLAHEVMTDIELDDLGNRGDRDDIIIIEAVAGVDLEPGCGGCLSAGDEAAFPLNARERGVAHWVFDLGRAAGLGTDTVPSAENLYLPLNGTRATGVIM